MAVTDKQIGLASTLRMSPGVYVPLLGAGVSKAAGLPLAHEITTELIGDLAAVAGDPAPADWEAAVGWYQSRFDEAPTYEGLLERLCPAPGDRTARLAGYFRRTTGTQSPIHRALALLARARLIRTVVTTNFDDLMEQALRDAGLDPFTVRSANDLAAARPFHIHDVVVIHIHGQWQDADSMRNTVDELGDYDEWIVEACQEAFRGHGKLIVGWSGGYDPSLRDILRRHHTDRYSTFWIDRASLTGEGARLATHLSAILLLGDADEILNNTVAMTERLDSRTSTLNPVNAAVVLAESAMTAGDITPVLRTLSTAIDRIERTPAMTTRDFSPGDTAAVAAARETEIASACAEAATIVMFLALNAPTGEATRWLHHAERLGVGPPAASGSTTLIHQQRLPGVILLASAAVGAAARNDPAYLAQILRGVQVPDDEGNDVLLLAHRYVDDAIRHQLGFTALNEYLKHLATTADVITAGEFDTAWERMEVAWSLLRVAATGGLPGWAPHGSVTGRLDLYTPNARAWAARSYRLDLDTHSALLEDDQPAIAQAYDRLYAELANTIAWTTLTNSSGAVRMPSAGWRMDETGRYAAPPAIRASLASALPGYHD